MFKEFPGQERKTRIFVQTNIYIYTYVGILKVLELGD